MFLFMYSRYYPLGGMNDLIGMYDSFEAALEAAKKYADDYDNYQITDNSGSILASGSTSSI